MELEVRFEGMGGVHEAALVASKYLVTVTSSMGKLRVHLQTYVDYEDFYFMPLEGCDVLLVMAWF